MDRSVLSRLLALGLVVSLGTFPGADARAQEPAPPQGAPVPAEAPAPNDAPAQAGAPGSADAPAPAAPPAGDAAPVEPRAPETATTTTEVVPTAPEQAPADEGDPQAEATDAAASASSGVFDPSVPAASRISQAATAILGHVVDAQTGEPIIEATVIVEQGTERLRTYTDMDGDFAIEVPPGLWVVRVAADFYREARHRPIRVRVGQRPRVTVRMRNAEDDHLVFEVVEVADRRSEAVLNQDRMNATTSQDAIGGQQMARTGASNAARAVSRVVGASLEGNTLIVRGLGDRYTNVLMNGVYLPGTDPDRNGVQLDVIPASVIANISVIKTFQPDVPANWAGGLMLIESQAMPREFEVRVSGSLGYNSQSTFRNTLENAGSRTDFLGFGLGARRTPSAVPGYVVSSATMLPDGSFVSPATAAEIGRSFSERWNYFRTREAPNGTLQFSIGDTVQLRGDRRIGYLTGFAYNRTASRRVSTNLLVRSVDPNDSDSVTLDSIYDSESSTEEVLLTAFATGSLRYSSNGDLRLLTLYTQHASDDTRFQVGNEYDNAAYVERWQFQYVQRSLLFLQLIGEQRAIPWFTDEGARLRYSAYAAFGRRDEPSTRQIRYEREDDVPTDPLRLVEGANGSDILSFDLDQRDAGGYVHFRFPLYEEGYAETGVDLRFSSRTSYFRQFHWQPLGSADPALLALDANSVLADANVNATGPIRFVEKAFPQNNYTGDSRWIGAFLTTDLRLTDWLRFAGGLRIESYFRQVDIVRPIDGLPNLDASTPSHVEAQSVDYLPGGTLIVSPNDAMNVRASYGVTVVHPQFREFAPVNFFEFARRRNVSGNEDLERTRIHNVDVRWEYLSGANGLFAVSGFYKRFLNPIERTNVAEGSRDLEYSNARAGFNVGAELEARFSIGQWDERSNWLDWFSVNGNLALVYSRVQLADDRAAAQPERERRMFLQSPYVANLSLGFDHPDSGVTLTLVYNTVGPRIVEVGFRNSGTVIPNVEEQAFHSLDLIGGYRIDDHWRLSLAVRNMLAYERTFKQGTLVIDQYNPGTEVGIGVSFTN